MTNTMMGFDPLPTGAVLGGRYRLLEVIGAGGMSRVYRAEDTRLGITVAVKENLQVGQMGQGESRRQFENEARLLAKLSHPNLPKVSDHFFDDETGRQYLVMEYIEGDDLETIVRRSGLLSEQVALNWLGQVLDALEYMHRQNPPIIHRDIKPANIKITPQGKAVLVDFGLVKLAGQGTMTGARAVTAGYSPPEQYGFSTSARSDIYALGATLYTLLTGLVPPEAPVLISGDRPLIPPRQVVSQISPGVEAALLRAMAMKTTERWESVSALRQALQGQTVAPTLSQTSPSPQPAASRRDTDSHPGVSRSSTGPRPGSTPKPGGLPIWAWGALAAVVVLAVAIGLTMVEREHEPEKPQTGILLAVGLTKTPTPTLAPTSTPRPTPVPDNAPKSQPKNDGSSQDNWDAVVKTYFAYLRDGPGDSAEAIEILQGGDGFDLLAVNKERTWVKITAPGRMGWIAVDKLELNISLDELTEVEASTKPTPTLKPTSTPRPTPTPTATMDADPTVYDNFNNPAHDGGFNQSLWTYWSDPPNQIEQREGMLVITKDGKVEGTNLALHKYEYVHLRTLTSNSPTFFEAKLMLDNNKHASGNVQLHFNADLVVGDAWFAECGIGDEGWAYCFDTLWPWQEEHSYDAEGKQVNYGEWHTFRIELDPGSMTFTYYIDGQVAGSHVPVDAEQLKNANFTVYVGVWSDSTDAIVGYIDDVRIGQVEPSTAASANTPATHGYLSQFQPQAVQVGYETFSIGRYAFDSDSESDNVHAGDPIIVHNVEYPLGLYAHAPSMLVYNLGGNFSEFLATIGMVQSIECGDGAEFIMQLDGNEIYHSPTMFSYSEPQNIQVSITNGQQLTLITDDGPADNNGCDWTIWGDPLVR
ncbi:MAG: NPCBM/NEW2 domain-containing protein [Anaerolineae bacterium]|nr:NPCBM/NEW2 domain-containing protein [Anaerolineae bacterium]